MKGFLVLTLISCAFASQDLCKNAVIPAGSTFKFADDPSHCEAYLYCSYKDDVLEAVYQGRCATGYNFKASTASCTLAASFPCTSPCEFNPVDSVIKIAEYGDITCRRFHTCTGTTLSGTVYNCSAPSVFNRNFGHCTPSSIAPCIHGETMCEIGNDGFFNDESSCGSYYLCYAGRQYFDYCSDGLHFNPKGNFCDYPANLDPPCIDALVESMIIGPEIPKPPHVSGSGRKF